MKLLFAQATVTEIVHVSENLRIPQVDNDLVPHDGAPPRYIRNIHDSHNENCPGKGIVHGDPTAWPPRSTDLNTFGFHMMGRFLNDIVYMQLS
jgi:hypothetical protein